MRRCPRCQRASRGRLASPQGFLERRVLPVLGLRPVRCPQCGERSLRPLWSRRGEDARRGPIVALPAGLNGVPPRQEKIEFDELVRRMGETERHEEPLDER